MVAIRIATVVMRVMVHHVYHVYEASRAAVTSATAALAHKYPGPRLIGKPVLLAI
jgi:hypothetical protein